MNWLDLAIVSVSLWGGIEGYFYGCRRMFIKTLVVIAAIFLANYFKNNFIVLLVVFFSMEEKIKTVISERLVVPVAEGWFSTLSVVERIEHMINELAIPSVLKTELLHLMYQISPETMRSMPEGVIVEEWLARLWINAIAFGLALAIWGGWLNLAEAVAMFRSPPSLENRMLRWGGAAVGLGRHFLLFSLCLGISGPFLWLTPGVFNALDIDSSLLACWSLKVFKICGFWW